MWYRKFNLCQFNIIDWVSTIGHDVQMESFNTLYPSVNISGCVTIGNRCEFGTGSKVIQQLEICDDCIIGAGGIVIRNLNESGVYVGVPVRLKN